MKNVDTIVFVCALLGLVAAGVGGFLKVVQIVALGVGLVALAVLLTL